MHILIVGAGGIGSWLSLHLNDAINSDQLSPDTSVTIADDDFVEEKNLSYQNFSAEDLFENKAETIADRYNFNYIDQRINEIPKNVNIVISCVDNTEFRKLLFTHDSENPEHLDYWIDLRSEGRTIAYFTKHKGNPLDILLRTLPKEVKNGSCQRPEEFQRGIIQHGNRIIASIGVQLLLNYHRGDHNQNMGSFNI